MYVSRTYPVFQLVTAALIGLLTLPGPTRAEDASDESLLRAKTSRQRHAKQAREIIDRLGISRFQARKLIPLAEQAAELHLEAYEQQAQLHPELLEAFAEFAAEDRLNQGFSREVERSTVRVNHRAKDLRERLAGQLIALEDQALEFLTSRQRERLDDFTPGHRLEKVRAGKEGSRRRSGATAASREKEVGDQRLRGARAELRALDAQLHPQPGPVGRFLLHPLGAEALCRAARVKVPAILREAADLLEHGSSAYPIEALERDKADVTEWRAKINNWNLINGLHLSAEQAGQIVALYDDALAAPKRDYAIRANQERRGASDSRLSRQALFSLERKVEAVLNSGQRQVLATYKACLIPPKNLRDPVRVGQANDNSRHEKWLDRARNLSGERLAEHIDRALETEAEHFGELSRSQRRGRVALLRKTVREAARMGDAEYELSKASLAERIAPADRKQELRYEIASLARECGEPGVIARFMLKPQFIEQLRVREQQLAEGADTTQIDLAQGPQADNCDVSCAIDGKRTKGKKTK